MVPSFIRKSQNGRFGLALVGQLLDGVQTSNFGRGNDLFLPDAKVQALGAADGMDTFRAVPNAGTVVGMFSDRAQAIPGGGCVVAASLNLQGNGHASLVVGRIGGIVRLIGYMGRSSRVVMFTDAGWVTVPSPVLLAMGLIAPQVAPTAVPDPDPVDGGFSLSLANAGLR